MILNRLKKKHKPKKKKNPHSLKIYIFNAFSFYFIIYKRKSNHLVRGINTGRHCRVRSFSLQAFYFTDEKTMDLDSEMTDYIQMITTFLSIINEPQNSPWHIWTVWVFKFTKKYFKIILIRNVWGSFIWGRFFFFSKYFFKYSSSLFILRIFTIFKKHCHAYQIVPKFLSEVTSTICSPIW